MKEELITYPTAKLAKDKGFAVPIKPVYAFDNWDYNEWRLFRDPLKVYNNSDKTEYGNISAPTQSLLTKWLREVHNIHINIMPNHNNTKTWDYVIYELRYTCWLGDDRNRTFKYNSYEEALEEGLFQGLKLIKT